MNGNLTLDYLLEPPAQPEYTECSRCSIALPSRSQSKQQLCQDCQMTSRIIAKGQRVRGARHDSAPEFEVTIHYSTSRYAASSYSARNEINRAGFTFLLCVVEDDPVAHHFVTDVLGHYVWPVVTVTSYGRLLAHWEGPQEGLFPNRYSQLQGLYQQVQAGTAKSLSF